MNNWYNGQGTAALNSQVEQQEILQRFISLFPSLKFNSWHLEAIWIRSMGLAPVVICLTALGDGQGNRVCVCACVCVKVGGVRADRGTTWQWELKGGI